MERKSELTKPNVDREISYTKQLRQARRKILRQQSELSKKMDSSPRKLAEPYYRGRTNVRHIGYGALCLE